MRRVKLQRRKGWRLPHNTKIVDRRTKWGNPFFVKQVKDRWVVVNGAGGALRVFGDHDQALSDCLEKYRSHVLLSPDLDLSELRAYSGLACWCRLDRSCHADILIDLVK